MERRRFLVAGVAGAVAVAVPGLAPAFGESTPLSAASWIQAKIDALPPTGGVVDCSVLGKYVTLDRTVRMNKPGITLIFRDGALISSTVPNCISIEEPDGVVCNCAIFSASNYKTGGQRRYP